MRYEPHQHEIAAVPTMTDEELLEYFLYRIFETDEVWGLSAGNQWQSRYLQDQETLPVWPYKRYAENAAIGDCSEKKPIAESVETFTYRILHHAAKTDQMIEIMPRGSETGCLINPQKLCVMLENMMEARESTLGD